MKGNVLGYNRVDDSGVIAAEDGNRYKFSQKSWSEEEAPQKGMQVDFIAESGSAFEIYIDALPSRSVQDDDGWYKSSNSKVLAGVCGGLAHKYEVSPTVLRVVTFLLAFFMGLAILLYVILWLILPAKPTK